MRCAIWYHLYNFKNVKNTHDGVSFLVELQAKSKNPPWMFSTFFKLYNWYQIAQTSQMVNVNDLDNKSIQVNCNKKHMDC